jgi:phenylpropionate dioxygenase-like ring-hydroxylating dioxygenase large terminal subunit
LHVPAHPDNGIPAKLHLKTYPAIERYGLIWTCLRPDRDIDAVSAQPPTMPHWDDPEFQLWPCPLGTQGSQ